MRWLDVLFILLAVFITALALAPLLLRANKEIATLTNTLTACRNTPAKLTRELTAEEMAAVIARTKQAQANRKWAEYMQGGRTPCPDGRECISE